MSETETTFLQVLPQTITALAALVGAVGGVWLGFLSYRKSKDNAKAIEIVRTDVNDKMQQLIKTTGEAEHAKGLKQGQEETQ